MRPAHTSIENGIPQYDRQVSVISPDGEYLGFVEDLWEPVWSPDGSRMAFVSHVYGPGEIFVMDYDGCNQRRLTTNDAEDHSPDW